MNVANDLIEFNVYDKREKEFYIALTSISFENAPQGISQATFMNSLGEEKTVENKDLIFLQYTGVDDDDGQKLFRHDIVQVNDHFLSGIIGYIIKEDFDWSLYYPYSYESNKNVWMKHRLSRDGFPVPSIKKLGNIYENADIFECEVPPCHRL